MTYMTMSSTLRYTSAAVCIFSSVHSGSTQVDGLKLKLAIKKGPGFSSLIFGPTGSKPDPEALPITLPQREGSKEKFVVSEFPEFAGYQTVTTAEHTALSGFSHQYGLIGLILISNADDVVCVVYIAPCAIPGLGVIL